MDERFFTSSEVAALVQVSPSTVLTWIDRGLLSCFRTPGGHRRIAADELVGFLRAHKMPVPRSLLTELRVLVIDDEVTLLKGLKRSLPKLGVPLKVEVAGGAVDGLLKVGTFRPNVVLLDAYMPGMDGIEVCKRLKAAPETAGIAVVAMTGRPSTQLESNFKKAGAIAVLVKPFQPAQVLDALADHGLITARESRT